MEGVLYSSIECVLYRNTQIHTDTYRHMHLMLQREVGGEAAAEGNGLGLRGLHLWV